MIEITQTISQQSSNGASKTIFSIPNTGIPKRTETPLLTPPQHKCNGTRKEIEPNQLIHKEKDPSAQCPPPSKSCLSSAKKKSQRSVHERCDETDNGISRLDNALLQPRRCGTPAKPTPSVPLPCRHDDNSDTVPTKFVHFATTSEAAEFEPNVPVERSLTPLSTHVATLRFPTTEPAQLTILEQADRDETKRNHAILQSIDATSDKHTCSRRRRTFVVRRDNNNDGDSAARGRRQKRQRRESFYITERILDAATKVPDDQSDEDDDAVEQLRRRKRRRRESVYWTETSTDPTVNEMFPSLSTNEEATKSLIAKIDDATNGCVESKIHIASLSTQRNPTSRALFGLDG